MSAESGRVQRPSPLKGALLGLLAQRQQGHGYDLASSLERRLGPGWSVNRKSVYRMLLALEREGLVSSDREEGAGADRIMYRSQLAAGRVLERWMSSVGSVGSVQLGLLELIAKMMVVSEEHLGELLDAFDAFERRCFELEREISDDLPSQSSRGSLRGAMMRLAREAQLLQLGAYLSWLAIARDVVCGWREP